MSDEVKPSSIKEILADAEKLNVVAKAAFDGVDADGSGFIDNKELATLMNGMAKELAIPAPSQAEIDESFKGMDADKNGKISLEEFKTLVVEILKLMA